jgi:DNA polymerase I-like protein with 3'-5' exonuclease and polymerase domains
MSNKDFMYQRICNFVGEGFNPSNDDEVVQILRSELNIHLPQRTTMEESLKATNSDHEIIDLILQYRAFG